MDNDYVRNDLTFMSGSGGDIEIPSVFVDYETGVTLKVTNKITTQK